MEDRQRHIQARHNFRSRAKPPGARSSLVWLKSGLALKSVANLILRQPPKVQSQVRRRPTQANAYSMHAFSHSLMHVPCRPHAGLMQASCRPHAGLMQAMCRPHAGLMQAMCRPHAGLMQASCSHVQASCRPHAGLMQATCRPHAGLMQATCKPHAGHMQASCRPHAGLMQAPCTTPSKTPCNVVQWRVPQLAASSNLFSPNPDVQPYSSEIQMISCTPPKSKCPELLLWNPNDHSADQLYSAAPACTPACSRPLA
eukprot:349906-Chlamydomonas_euryale.AAC.2